MWLGRFPPAKHEAEVGARYCPTLPDLLGEADHVVLLLSGNALLMCAAPPAPAASRSYTLSLASARRITVGPCARPAC